MKWKIETEPKAKEFQEAYNALLAARTKNQQAAVETAINRVTNAIDKLDPNNKTHMKVMGEVKAKEKQRIEEKKGFGKEATTSTTIVDAINMQNSEVVKTDKKKSADRQSDQQKHAAELKQKMTKDLAAQRQEEAKRQAQEQKIAAAQKKMVVEHEKKASDKAAKEQAAKQKAEAKAAKKAAKKAYKANESLSAPIKVSNPAYSPLPKTEIQEGNPLYQTEKTTQLNVQKSGKLPTISAREAENRGLSSEERGELNKMVRKENAMIKGIMKDIAKVQSKQDKEIDGWSISGSSQETTPKKTSLTEKLGIKAKEKLTTFAERFAPKNKQKDVAKGTSNRDGGMTR